ncbi:SARP family transcriptional regulator [Lentzea cavernae]|uniref:SARP family transcriptional regulator n=2 Tax=Lentzea cavernae TaxID=2020703 RepID=A0ABQ3MG38_9PSEU|nr:SARP family transcriptional regulator [Lentzea cavernae]
MGFRLLGPVEIRDEMDRLVPLRGQRDRALLALLLLNANREVRKESLESDLWTGRPPKDGLADYIKSLRRVLRETFRESVGLPRIREASKLVVDESEVDHLRFRARLDSARGHADPEHVVREVRAALGEWRGEALQNLNDDVAWVVEHRAHLKRQRREAWGLLIQAELELGRHTQVLGEIREPLADWPEDEALVCFYMLASYRAGSPSDALEAYRKFYARLRDESGVEPSFALSTLHQRILSADPTLDLPVVVNWPVGVVVSLPQRPLLLGREDDLTALRASLSPGSSTDVVMVSTAVSGLAGVGKTTLAVFVAHEVLEAGWFTGGVLFLDMRGYSPIPLVVEEALLALLLQLGVPSDRIPVDGQDREVRYRAALADRTAKCERLLIVADNVSSSEQVRALIPGTSEHRLLITTRNRLADLDNARLLTVDVLAPADAIAVLDLHLRSALPADVRIAGEADAAAEVARLCGYLPLALRICAALLASDPAQPVAELAEELESSSSRLRTLDYGGALAVRAAFDLSYERLTPEQARLFKLLSLKTGRHVSSEAASALGGLTSRDARRLLQELQRAHLIDSATARGWWSFHDLIDLYASERVNQEHSPEERDEALVRLLDHYLKVSHAAADHLDRRAAATARSARFGGREQALAWMEAERDALVGAVARAHEGGHNWLAYSIAEQIDPYFVLKKHPADWVATQQLALAAARKEGDVRAQSSALNNLGHAYRFTRSFDEAIACHLQALAIRRDTGDRPGEGMTLNNLGMAYRELRRFDDAIGCYLQAIDLRRAEKDLLGEATALNNLGASYWAIRRFEDAVECYESALAIRERTADRRGESITLNNLGVVYRELLRWHDAVDCLTRSLLIRREVGDPQGEGDTLNNLGLAHRDLGRYADAVGCHRQALPLYEQSSDRRGEGVTLNHLGVALAALEEFDEAIDCHRRSLAVLSEIGDRQREAMVMREIGKIRRTLGDPCGARQWWERALEALYGFTDDGVRHQATEIRALLDGLT